MTPSSYSLPSEVILTIQQISPTFSTASALSQSSHAYHNLWIANIPSICSTIFPRAIEFYDQACVLFEAQEKITPIDQALARRLKVALKSACGGLPEIIFVLQASPDTTKAIERVRRFASNANTIYTALDRFDITAVRKNQMQALKYRDMTPTERASFIKAYYRVTALDTLAKGFSLHELLAPLDMLDLWQI